MQYYHLDVTGSVRAVTDQNGNVVERHDYLPFGQEWNPPASSQPRLFLAAEHDPETGLDYLVGRYYLAGTARFTTADFAVFADPSNPQSWHLYVYAFNNPMRFVDPSAHDPCQPGSIATFCSTTTAPNDSSNMGALKSYYWFLQTIQQLSVDIERAVKRFESGVTALSPTRCGGGAFAYGGFGAESGRFHSGVLAVISYDSLEGGAHGVIGEVGYGPVAVGRELSRSWNDWQEHWTYLGFLSGEKGPIGSGPMRIKKSEWGGVFQPNPDGSISVGGYLGANIGVGRDVGTGGYMNLSWNGCK